MTINANPYLPLPNPNAEEALALRAVNKDNAAKNCVANYQGPVVRALSCAIADDAINSLMVSYLLPNAEKIDFEKFKADKIHQAWGYLMPRDAVMEPVLSRTEFARLGPHEVATVVLPRAAEGHHRLHIKTTYYGENDSETYLWDPVAHNVTTEREFERRQAVRKNCTIM